MTFHISGKVVANPCVVEGVNGNHGDLSDALVGDDKFPSVF